MNHHADSEQRAAIRPVKERVEDELLARPGVVAVDIGEKVIDGRPTGELSIVVRVVEKKRTAELAPQDVIPTEVDGVRTDVQQGTVVLQRVGHLIPVTPQVDKQAYATLVGGVSMGPHRMLHLEPPDVPEAGDFSSTGTLGGFVQDRVNHTPMALTNFHVACMDTSWGVGDVMLQPSRGDGGTLAHRFGTLARAVLTDSTDGAVVAIDPGRAFSAGEIAEIGFVAGQATATEGMSVQKRGRTTEHTFGTVTSTDATVAVDYEDGVGSRVLRHQIAVEPDARNASFSRRGDSGAMVLDMERNVVGLLFAGLTDGSVTYVNPIQTALDELGVDLLTGPVFILPVTRPTDTCPIEFKDPLSRVWLCREPSRFIPCLEITRNPPCTRPPLCELVDASRFCNWGDLDPGRPLERGPSWSAASQYGAWRESLGASYVAGYLAALQEAAGAPPSEDGR